MFIFPTEAPATLEWPVTVELPSNGGATLKQTFTGTFRRLSDAEGDALRKTCERPDLEGQTIRGGEENAAFFGAVLSDWQGVTDEAGSPVPYSAERLKTLLTGISSIPLAIGLWRAWGEMRTGAAAKN